MNPSFAETHYSLPENFSVQYRLNRDCRPTSPITVSLKHLNQDMDAERLHRWMHFEHVIEFWQQAWPLAQIQRYLEDKIASYHEVFWLTINDRPIAYAELYPVAQDVIAPYCGNQQDWGWHLLIGPKAYCGSGLSPAIGHCIASFLFKYSHASNLYCEPDHRNTRMIRYLEKLGYSQLAKIRLPEKHAVLMQLAQNDFNQIAKPELYFKPKQGFHYGL